MAVDLKKFLGLNHIHTLAVQPGYAASKMTAFYGEDDMDTCTSSLIQLIKKFGAEDEGEGKNGCVHGGHVRWNGEVMAY